MLTLNSSPSREKNTSMNWDIIFTTTEPHPKCNNLPMSYTSISFGDNVIFPTVVSIRDVMNANTWTITNLSAIKIAPLVHLLTLRDKAVLVMRPDGSIGHKIRGEFYLCEVGSNIPFNTEIDVERTLAELKGNINVGNIVNIYLIPSKYYTLGVIRLSVDKD